MQMPIVKGYVYSMASGLLRYDGPYGMVGDEYMMVHKFTVVKPLPNITRDVKAWDKYRVSTHGEKRHTDCIFFEKEVFTLMQYEPKWTVLYGAKDGLE